MSQFYFKVIGDGLENFAIVDRSERISIEESSLDVAKVKAESYCKKRGFNAFIDYDASSNSANNTVVLTGSPALIKFSVKKIAGGVLSDGVEVGKSVGSKVAYVFKKLW